MFEKKVKEGYIGLPFSSKECRGKNYKIVENKIKDLGFVNIQITFIPDIKISF